MFGKPKNDGGFSFSFLNQKLLASNIFFKIFFLTCMLWFNSSLKPLKIIFSLASRALRQERFRIRWIMVCAVE